MKLDRKAFTAMTVYALYILENFESQKLNEFDAYSLSFVPKVYSQSVPVKYVIKLIKWH